MAIGGRQTTARMHHHCRAATDGTWTHECFCALDRDHTHEEWSALEEWRALPDDKAYPFDADPYVATRERAWLALERSVKAWLGKPRRCKARATFLWPKPHPRCLFPRRHPGPHVNGSTTWGDPVQNEAERAEWFRLRNAEEKS